MPISNSSPSVERRIAALRELFPLLPLLEPQPLFTETGRGERVIPWIQYYVSDVNIDETDRIAALVGTTSENVYAELDEFFAAHPSPSLLTTREALEGLPALEHVFEFEQFAAHNDDDGPPAAVWWTLSLPVLNPALDAALVCAQLGGRFGAEDFWWLARKTHGVWTLGSASVRP